MEKTIKSLLKIAKSCLQVNKSSGTKRLPNILKYEFSAPFSPVKHLNFASIVFRLNVKFTYHHFPAKSFEFRAIFGFKRQDGNGYIDRHELAVMLRSSPRFVESRFIECVKFAKKPIELAQFFHSIKTGNSAI